jgi:DNA-directed RNA polymerase specialized sigma24 family protein
MNKTAAKTKVKKAKKSIKPRNTYTPGQRSEAKRYYLIGLNLQEISKLLDNIPIRTLENWQTADQWTALKGVENIKKQAFNLHEAGKSYSEISEILNISRVSVWRYIKEANQK